MPARSSKLRDKSNAEVALPVVERWILARLHHQTSQKSSSSQR